MNNINIRPATIYDIPTMVALSYNKRRHYEQAQPQFWRYAGEGAEQAQQTWFIELLKRDDVIMFVAEEQNTIQGFIVGQVMKAPAVYDPEGLTLMIDDFCVNESSLWPSVGQELLNELIQLSRLRGCTQVIVVSGAHDETKRQFLQQQNLICASEWYVKTVEKQQSFNKITPLSNFFVKRFFMKFSFFSLKLI